MPRESRNIFISHIQEDEGHIKGLKDELRRSGLVVRDSSVYSGKNRNNARNEDYIKSLLARRIKWAGTVIVIVSKATRRHDWVNWEIDNAQKGDTRIVGVWAPGETECAVPDTLRKFADAMVPWKGTTIRDAIDDKVKGWHSPTGEKRPLPPLPNIVC